MQEESLAVAHLDDVSITTGAVVVMEWQKIAGVLWASQMILELDS